MTTLSTAARVAIILTGVGAALFMSACSSRTQALHVRLTDCQIDTALTDVTLEVQQPLRILPSFPVARATTDMTGHATLRMPADNPGKTWKCSFTWRSHEYSFPLDLLIEENGMFFDLKQNNAGDAVECVRVDVKIAK